MDYSETLDALGIEHLGDIPLEGLATKIGLSADQISHPRILEVFMGWLHEQIKKDNTIQQRSFLPQFVALLLHGAFLGGDVFAKEEIKQAFEEWKARDSVENPTNVRRYLLTGMELDRLLGEAQNGPIVASEPLPSSESPSMHEIRAARLQEMFSRSSLEDVTNQKEVSPLKTRKGKGFNAVPLGQREPHMAGIREDPETNEDLPRSSRGTASAECSRTAATAISPLDVMGPLGVYRKKAFPTGFDINSTPPKGYTCKRCERPGT